MLVLKIENSWNPFYKKVFLKATEDKRCVWDFYLGPRLFSLKKGACIDILVSRSQFELLRPHVGGTMNFAEVAPIDFRRIMSDSHIPSRSIHQRENTLL